MRRALRILIRGYQLIAPNLIVSTCKYHPRCSEYALAMLEKAPVHIAVVKIVLRIVRCNPFSKGGYDPV